MTILNLPDFTEDAIVEQPAIALFGELGWDTANCYTETYGPTGSLGRENRGEVVLASRLRVALEKLNPSLPAEAIELAIEELACDRSTMSLAQANREICGLLKDGVRVTLRVGDDEERTELVRVIEWGNPAGNDFFLASQFWIQGDMYTRRADLIGFVNGLPLVFFELKAPHHSVKDAYGNYSGGFGPGQFG